MGCPSLCTRLYVRVPITKFVTASVRGAHHLRKTGGFALASFPHVTLVLAERNRRLVPNLTMGSRLVVGLLALLSCACNVVVAAGLEENDANRIALALEGTNVDAQK